MAQDRILADGLVLIVSVAWGRDGRDSLEVRDEEGRVCKGGVISCQPAFVASIPSQGVEVAQKCRFLYVLFHEFVQCEECWFVSLVDEACGAHLKWVHCAVVASDVCDKVWIFLCLLCIPLVNVHSHWEGQFIDVQDFLVIVKNDNVRFEVGDRCTSQLEWCLLLLLPNLADHWTL